MDIWYGVAVGAFIGVGFSLLVFLYKIGSWYIGNLREDRSSGDDGPYYFMEISKGASGRIRTSKFVLLRVKREDYLSKPITNSTSAVMEPIKKMKGEQNNGNQ